MDRVHLLFLFTHILLSSSTKVTESIEESSTEHNTTNLQPIVTKDVDHNPSSEATVWKLETSYGESGETESRNQTDSRPSVQKPDNHTEEFKPSPHLGNIIEDYHLPMKPGYGYYDSYGDVIKRPATGFKSPTTTKGFDWSYDTFPFRIETPILTRAKYNRIPSTEHTGHRPQTYSEVPAGGLYQLQDPFREKPADDDNHHFGLQFHTDMKDEIVKKRMNPWKEILRLMTAVIPVGLIISALTPSLITIQSTGLNHQYPVRVRRGATVAGVSSLISETCKRRLLCELHADKYYQQPVPKPHVHEQVTSECVKFRCKDLNSVKKLVYWLLKRHATGTERNHIGGHVT